MTRLEALERLVFGTRETIAGTVYGTIVVMGAVTAGSGGHPKAGPLAAIAATTVLVLWIAHVYSHALAETIQQDRRLDRAELADVARRELPIALAAVGPVAALLLGAVGLLKDQTALWVAMGVGLAILLVEGIRYAQVESLRGVAALASVGFTLGLGLVIVALKVAVAH